jgi:hypothetical protein
VADWITEGTAHRTRVQVQPVIHLVVRDSGRFEWSMWCSGGQGRQDTVLYIPGRRPRFCPECRGLAQDAVDDGTLAPSDLTDGWRLRTAAGE